MQRRRLRSSPVQSRTSGSLNEARDLQRQLGPNNPLSRELEGIVNNLQGLMSNANRLGDPSAIAKLADQIIEPFRGVEMELSRALQIMLAKENIRSAQEDEIPAGYQKVRRGVLQEAVRADLGNVTQKQ